MASYGQEGTWHQGSMVHVRLDEAAIQEAAAALEGIKNGLVRAYARALNSTADDMRRAMVAMGRDEYSYKVADLSKRIYVHKTDWSNLRSFVRSKGDEVSLTGFLGTRPVASGISVDVKKSTGRKIIPRTFLNYAKSGHQLVLRRPGKPHGQYHVLYGRYGPPGSGGKLGSRARLDWFAGPHPELIWNTQENWNKLQTEANERLAVNFAEEVDGVLRQYG